MTARVQPTRTRRAITAVLVSFVVTACGSHREPSGEPAPSIGPIRVVTDASQISLPLDAYQMSVEEDLLLQRAEWRLAVECMARFGIAYEPPKIYPGLSNTNHERLYGLLDLEKASGWGYVGEDPAKLSAAQQAADRARPPESEKAEELLGGPLEPNAAPVDGTPEGGCMGEARRQLAAGHEPVDENLVFDMAYVAGARAEADERVQAAFARWSDCMDRAGFDYGGPWEPNNHPWPRHDNIVSAQEKAVATADVTCKHKTNLAGVWNAVGAAHQLHLIEQNRQLLAALKQSRAYRLERAAAILSGAP
jgi:hypothetical protein